MKPTKEKLKKRIAVASHKEPADLVIKNGKIIDVFNLDVFISDIAIVDGIIVGIGKYNGHKEIDATGRYIAPGFIDGHVHIESSMVTPTEFSKVVLPHGITSVITDPHEIANVLGSEGISFMLNDSEDLKLDVNVMLPSCVPATPFENAGAKLMAKDLEPFFAHPRVLGLAEVMDYPAVMNNDSHMLDKLITTSQYTDKIDGHAAGLNTDGINVYCAAGIRTDHECVTEEEAKERLRRGMYVLIRQGSAAKNLPELIRVVNERNSRRCLFCTDDKHLDELISEGSIDHNVRLAINLGLDPLIAIQMGSLNVAECYGLTTKGAIAPGFDADLLILEDLEAVKIEKVYKSGQLVAENGQVVHDITNGQGPSGTLTNSVNIPDITIQDLQITIKNNQKANVIGIIPNQIITKKLIEEVDTVNDYFVPSIEKDLLKLVVIERHKKTGNIGLGIVKGLKLIKGAIASTVAHDSHNLVVTGTNDRDILVAINAIQKMNGGLVIVENEKVVSSISLPIAGLISTKDYITVNQELHELHDALNKVRSSDEFNLFLTLSFLCLPVIPELKLTDLGLFDVNTFEHIDVS